jgi:hypothetical protein
MDPRCAVIVIQVPAEGTGLRADGNAEIFAVEGIFPEGIQTMLKRSSARASIAAAPMTIAVFWSVASLWLAATKAMSALACASG